MTEDEIRKCLLPREKTKSMIPRRRLGAKRRAEVRAKTGGRCHVCAEGLKADDWQADHIAQHTFGGECSDANFLPICGACNRLRWSYPSDVIRLIFRLGVYAKHEIRQDTKLGRQLLKLAAKRMAMK
jgi:5-methylcytosine-specific restriction endonuclease McrA